MTKDELKQRLIEAYSHAYQNLGYSSLMGKMVGLLLISPEALSLDQISEELKMSKGPISQIARRLKDHKLIEKEWVPGERKDFYRAAEDIFGQAFRNYTSSMRQNRKLGERFAALSEEDSVSDLSVGYFNMRMKEMKAFYGLMDDYHRQFLKAWEQERTSFLEAKNQDS
ncbi:MAG: MarR family transcriptional regulator [Bacteroidota bacterium]